MQPLTLLLLHAAGLLATAANLSDLLSELVWSPLATANLYDLQKQHRTLHTLVRSPWQNSKEQQITHKHRLYYFIKQKFCIVWQRRFMFSNSRLQSGRKLQPNWNFLLLTHHAYWYPSCRGSPASMRWCFTSIQELRHTDLWIIDLLLSLQTTRTIGNGSD